MNRSFKRLRNEIFDPREPLFRRWSKIFVCTCLIAVSVDLLFFYIPEINEHEKCLDLDGALKITACVLRSIFDLIYILHIIFQLRTGFIVPSSRAYGRGGLIADSVATLKRYLSGYFVIDILSIIPLPQVVVLGVIPILKSSVPFGTIDLLKIIIFVQYLPRVIRIYPIWKQMPRTSAILTGSGTAWSAAASNLLFYILASHVVGSSYYLFSVESELRCWQQELKNYKLYNVVHSYDVSFSCGQYKQTIVSLLNTSCFFIGANEMKDSTAFDFGIFNEALSAHVVESSTYFLQKFFYCFWWGLRNISSLGQNLQTSTFIWEIFFAIFISIFGLVLFSVIIGNMQRYLQSRIADDLKFVASQFRRLHSRKMQHTFRFYSMQWRTWAACYIQKAWRSYWKKKMERSLFEAEARLPDAPANEVGSPIVSKCHSICVKISCQGIRIHETNGTT
ncbi:hypothetical protein L6164_004020 [Bauhinia variegata]|uniref:Uncharacterized protein n=1 Tax=Bauhinia variegata TaxID=167791 RepID=A0ACB9Q2J9_BAUVA|nr:hypothetical protein L6164_004020 [Bauhinia variegata]